jgi:FkbM family methyltransferase
VLKYAVAELVKQNPRLMATVWNLIPRLNILLPHDRAYYGFRHVTGPSPAGLFLDIGANNGISAAGFRKVVSRPYRILSIEASPVHRASLERLKRVDPEFDYRIVALGRAPGELTIYTPYAGTTALTAFSSTSLEYMREATTRDYGAKAAARLTHRASKVRIVTLDSFGLAPTLIKTDVEGADYDVLMGGERTIRQYRPVIMLEYTPVYSEPIVEFLRSIDYHLLVYDADADRFGGFDATQAHRQWSSGHLQVNVFAMPHVPAATDSNGFTGA